MNSLRNAYYSAKHYAYEKGINALARDKGVRDFQATGQLTPQEFMAAGDHLTMVSPLWTWQPAPNSSSATGPLPREKSFLMYRGAPCRRWTEEEVGFRSIDEEDDGTAEAPLDSEDDDLAGLLVHTVADSIHHIYDVSVTYSQPHHTPQIFFTGYTADRSRGLTDKEMEEDVTREYFGIDKTVTIENHPFLNVRSVSVHPCRHAESMRRQVDRARRLHESRQQNLPEEDREPFTFQTHTSLVLFLKFISVVTPTIQYDTTSEFIY